MTLKELLVGGGVRGTGGTTTLYADSIEAWLPIRNIIDGVVVTKDNRFVKILEVQPVNFALKSADDQRDIIAAFAAYLKIAPDTLQIEARTLPPDTSEYIRRMEEYARNEENEFCREMIEDNIREIARGVAGETVRHRFFLIFQYEANMRARQNTVKAIAERMNEEADTARRYLDACEVVVMEPQYADNFTLKLLYEILNKRTGRRVALPDGVFDMTTVIHGVYEEDTT